MKAVIPAAGLGARFYPWTLQNPKELVPVINIKTKRVTAVIDLVVKEAHEAGCTDLLLITALGKSGIKDHLTRQQLTDNMPKEIRLHYTDQQGAKGLGDAVYYSKSFVGTADFIVLLGDDFYDNNPVVDLLNAYDTIKFDGKFGAILTVQKVPESLTKRYGIVKIKNHGKIMEVEDLVEKPIIPPSNYAITGRYILSNKIFSYIKNTLPAITLGKEVELTNAIRAMLADGYKVYCIEISGKRYDVGDPDGWIQTITEINAQMTGE